MALFSFKQGVYEKYGSLLNAINKNESNLETLNNIELRERVIRLKQQIKSTNLNMLLKRMTCRMGFLNMFWPSRPNKR